MVTCEQCVRVPLCICVPTWDLQRAPQMDLISTAVLLAALLLFSGPEWSGGTGRGGKAFIEESFDEEETTPVSPTTTVLPPTDSPPTESSESREVAPQDRSVGPKESPSFHLPFWNWPLYDPDLMTPSNLVEEAAEFLTLQNIPKARWTSFVSKLFPPHSEPALWWEATKGSVKDWTEFSSQFVAHEEAAYSKDALRRRLLHKRQGPSEALETYAWDVAVLYRRMEPGADVQDIISRIVNSALPPLAIHLRQHEFESISALNSKARNIIHHLNVLRRSQGKPLLHSTRTPTHYQHHIHK